MTTPFLSICPNCRAKLKLKNPDRVGKRAKCPQCSEPFVVKRVRPKAKPQPVAATSASPPVTQKTTSADDDWLNDDLGSFDTTETLSAGGDTLVPPMVTGTKIKRRGSASGTPRKRRRREYDEPSVAISCLLAAMAGGVAAFIGAGIWLAIIMMTGYEIGLLAWAIGGLVGFATLLGSREHIVGDLSGMIGAVVALAAVTGPKFLLLLIAHLLEMHVGLGDLFTVFDVLWIFLAVGTAFRVASGQGGEE